MAVGCARGARTHRNCRQNPVMANLSSTAWITKAMITERSTPKTGGIRPLNKFRYVWSRELDQGVQLRAVWADAEEPRECVTETTSRAM